MFIHKRSIDAIAYRCSDTSCHPYVIQINEGVLSILYHALMIQLVNEGTYQLIETKGDTKILTLDKKKAFAWVHAKGIGELLVASHIPHKVDHLLAVGKYRTYEVHDEPMLTDLTHLELFVGEGYWQSYVLPNGLPDDTKLRNRIIPTKEVITKSKF